MSETAKLVIINEEFGRVETVDRELENRFEKDIVVYNKPGLSLYFKSDWRLLKHED